MKKLITNYTFDSVNKTVKLLDYDQIDLGGLLLITNTTDGIIVYNFADTTLRGTVSGNTITLAYDTTTMDSGDRLQIFYDDGIDITNVQVTDTLRQILFALQNPPYIDKAQNRIRETSVIESGTVTTVGAVNGFSNFGSQPADVLYRLTSQNTWSNVTRRTIS